MKEKYTYDSIKDNYNGNKIIAVIVLILMAFLLKFGGSMDRWLYILSALILLPLMVFSVSNFSFNTVFLADDNAVTFGRVFRKKIPYSSIKSIDIRHETRSYTYKKSKRTYVAEIITFHCEDGDHSFAGMIEPSRKSLTYIQGSTGVSAEDKANSAFSRLKYFIESKRYL